VPLSEERQEDEKVPQLMLEELKEEPRSQIAEIEKVFGSFT